jgi:hypothetical protein
MICLRSHACRRMQVIQQSTYEYLLR